MEETNMPVYNKLIRDRIPEIIKNSGRNPIITTLNDEEYLIELNKKLQEELDEYYKDQSTEELADLVEVVYAILKHKGVSHGEFEAIRKDKATKRGAFNDKLFLKEVID